MLKIKKLSDVNLIKESDILNASIQDLEDLKDDFREVVKNEAHLKKAIGLINKIIKAKELEYFKNMVIINN